MSTPAPRTQQNPLWFNRIMMSMLRSPLHGFVSKSTMIITMSGRKSGNLISTPVSYFRHGNEVLAAAGGRWWVNLQGGKPVKLLIEGKEVCGTAEAIVGKEAVAPVLQEFLTNLPGDARWHKVRLDADRKPIPEDVQRAAEKLVMVKVRLD